MKQLSKGAFSWALYDWANTGYAMIGLALIFPQLYKGYWGAGLAADKQTFFFNLTVSLASLAVAVLAPILGSVAELGGLRKRLLLRFAMLGICACGCMALAGKDQYLLASLIYLLGTVSFYCANIFYDSMLERVSETHNRHFVSGLGFSFGYSAGFCILLLSAFLLKNPGWLGLENATGASRALFIFAAIWWAIFTIPLALRLKEGAKPERPPFLKMAQQGFKETWTTLKEIIGQKHILWFLLAYLFYIDGVNTIITTASNYGSTIGFTQAQIITAFFIVQVFGMPCAVLFGLLGQHFGPRRIIFVAILIYLGVTSYGATISPEPLGEVFGFEIYEMYILAALIGMVQGGIQALSRSYYTSIIPPEKNVAYFGFYSMIGKSAAVLGPLLMGLVALVFNDPERPDLSTRLGMGSVALLFIIGAFFLSKARPLEAVAGTQAARN